jgi:hypothetical protein
MMADGYGIGMQGFDRPGYGPIKCLNQKSLIATKSQKHETEKLIIVR